MSEFLYHDTDKIGGLLQFARGIVNGENGAALIQRYRHHFDNLTPRDVVEMEDRLLQQGITVNEIKATIGKVVNVFFQYLRQYPWTPPAPDTFIGTLMRENQELERRLGQTRDLVRELNRSSQDTLTDVSMLNRLREQIRELTAMDRHYLKKENILFPYLEKHCPWSRPLQVMWSIDDDCRKIVRDTLTQLSSETVSMKELNTLLGQLYFLLHGMKFKEELVLFPLATETCSPSEFEVMHRQAHEIGFAFIAPPRITGAPSSSSADDNSLPSLDPIPLGTGSLTPARLTQVCNALPVDITVVNEADEVVYFSNPTHRIFSRSPAIIGRKVQNCHPPESMAQVQALLDAFRSGEKDEETFWIQMKERFIVIRYVALRDPDGRYRGCLEVSQDVTGIRRLEGEKRL